MDVLSILQFMNDSSSEFYITLLNVAYAYLLFLNMCGLIYLFMLNHMMKFLHVTLLNCYRFYLSYMIYAC
jgi:hypothetical protein